MKAINESEISDMSDDKLDEFHERLINDIGHPYPSFEYGIRNRFLKLVRAELARRKLDDGPKNHVTG